MSRLLKRLRPLLGRRTGTVAVIVAAFIIQPFALRLPDPAWPNHSPLVGFTFTPSAARNLGYEPQSALAALLDKLPSDVVRLPIYWYDAQPTAGTWDYSSVDDLLATVRRHNAKGGRQTRVILVLGIRNLGFPEVHVPQWMSLRGARNPGELMQTPEYEAYIAQTVVRYRSNPLLYSWQIENEPLDTTITEGQVEDPIIPEVELSEEVGRVRQLDPRHKVVVTTYNSAALDMDFQAASALSPIYKLLGGPLPMGHPYTVSTVADALGLDLYVVTPFTPLDQTPAVQRIIWKGASLAYWSEYAKQRHKEVWVMEMQASPWLDTSGFTPLEMLESAEGYQGSHASLILLWGVEYYLKHPAWFATARQAMDVLRLQTPATEQQEAKAVGLPVDRPAKVEQILGLRRLYDGRHGTRAF